MIASGTLFTGPEQLRCSGHSERYGDDVTTPWRLCQLVRGRLGEQGAPQVRHLQHSQLNNAIFYLTSLVLGLCFFFFCCLVFFCVLLFFCLLFLFCFRFCHCRK